MAPPEGRQRRFRVQDFIGDDHLEFRAVCTRLRRRVDQFLRLYWVALV
jgi:hypothetical protein